MASACHPQEPEVHQLTAIPGDEGLPAFNPTGTHVAFSVTSDGESDLMTLDLVSGDTTRVVKTPDVSESLVGWTPDGEALVYLAAEPSGPRLRAVSEDGRDHTPLTPPDVRPSRPVVAPVGDWIVYATSDSDSTTLWRTTVAGAEQGHVVTRPGRLIPYGWSPDAAAVLVLALGDEGQDLFRVDAHEGTMHRLTEHPNEEWQPRWSPDGSRIAYYTTYGDSMTDIRVLSLEDAAPMRLTGHPAEDFFPSWSPDGRRLAFLSDRSSKSGLWTVDVATGTVEAVLPEARLRSRAVWSPDGETIAFLAASATSRLFRVAAEGGEPEPVTSDSLEVRDPVPSPDGRRIVFRTMDWGSEADVGMLDLETGRVERLTGEHTYLRAAGWSPDGGRLAVVYSTGGWIRTHDVWIFEADGSKRTRLTDSGWVQTPIWCGDHVYFQRALDPPAGRRPALWRIPAAGGEDSLVLDSIGTETPTDCLRDGSLLYTLAGPEGSTVRRLDLDGDGVVIADVAVVEKAWAGRASGDGRIVFLADRDNQTDVYVRAAGGGDEIRVTNTRSSESSPSWGPDDQSLWFSAAPGGTDIWLVRL